MHAKVPAYKKNDFGYTIGGPIFIPGHYNTDKSKTFFFWSQEWRLESVPNTFNSRCRPMRSALEISATFARIETDLSRIAPTCPAAGPRWQHRSQRAAILAEITAPNNTTETMPALRPSALATTPPSRSPLLARRIVARGPQFSYNLRGMFHYIHDSWNTTTPTTLWSNATLPSIQTKFVGPTTSAVARLTYTASPTLVNELSSAIPRTTSISQT